MNPREAASRWDTELDHIQCVGSVPRWTKFKRTWKLDTDYMQYREKQRIRPSQLAFQPSKRSIDVEEARIKDYDRKEPECTAEMSALLSEAIEWAKLHFRVGPVQPSMSIDEAIEFVIKSECADRSPGYPLNQKYKTKKEALEDPEVVRDLRDWWSKLGTDKVQGVLMSLSLKDEMLKTEKIETKQTRLFMAMPLYHHVAMVACFQRAQDQIFESGATWCSAGRDFHYGGWNHMITSLLYSHMFGADAKAYDMSITRLLFDAALCVLLSLADPLLENVIVDLFAMALDGFCVTSRGDVLLKHIGNPSGWFLTLLLNTIIMYLLLAMSFKRKFPEATKLEFETFVHAWLCGDDSLVAVAPSIADVFTAQAFIDVWSMFGIECKKYVASTNVEELEYCGATSVLVLGRWARRPRVEKFLDMLYYCQSRDPQRRLERAMSIYHEMWPVPEREVVLGYIDFLCQKYKYLGSWRRRLSLSDGELTRLHIGLEGTLCKQGRAKKNVYADLSSGVSSHPQSDLRVGLSSMTKTKSQKARAAVNAVKREPGASRAAIAQEIASTVATRAKKNKKKGGGGFWGFLGGAAKMAADLAPIVAPLLLANHGPTRAAAGMLAGAGGSTPSVSSAGAEAASAPLAAGSCVTCTGLYSMVAKRGGDGRVMSVTVRGMDYIDDLTVAAQAEGVILREIDLNPHSINWSGTMLQRQASLFERYRPKHILAIYEPSCAATTAGQIMSYIDPDPDDPSAGQGRAAIQQASAHAGCDVSQLWAMNCAHYTFDEKTQDFYSDPEGSDRRLISPGVWRILSATTMPAGQIAGSLYVAWEYEFKVPQLENIAHASYYAQLQSLTGGTDNAPFGTGSTWSSLVNAATATFAGTYSAADGFSKFARFPPGLYFACVWFSGSTNPGITLTVDGTCFQDAITPANLTVPSFLSMFAGSATEIMSWYLIRSTRFSASVNDGFIRIINPTGAASVTNAIVVFLSAGIPSYTVSALGTLQDFERQTSERLQLLEATLAQLQSDSASTTALARAKQYLNETKSRAGITPIGAERTTRSPIGY